MMILNCLNINSDIYLHLEVGGHVHHKQIPRIWREHCDKYEEVEVETQKVRR